MNSDKNIHKKSVFSDLKALVGMAMFSALAYAVTFVFRIPVSFLTFDAKDAVLTVAAFIYGPVAAVAMSLLTSLLELFTISSTMWWGFVMNFLSSACFSGVSSLIYKHKRSFNGAIIGLYAAAATTTSVMMLLNIVITPIYTGMPVSAVIAIIPTLLLPFNLAKTLMNTAFAMFLYKPVTLAMKRAGLISGGVDVKFNRRSAVMLVIGAATLILASTIFIILKFVA